jgi:hypothetical protein
MISREFKDGPNAEQPRPPQPNHRFRNIGWPSLLTLVVALLALRGTSAAVTLNATQRSAICASRATCSIEKIYDAGKSPAGTAIAVAEVSLGLKDKPKDAPDEGCSDSKGGGVEYWLLDGIQAPQQILKLCNDSDEGDDVTVNDNLLIDRKSGGGSQFRSESATRYMLSPLRVVGRRDCSYDVRDMDESGGSAVQMDVDLQAMIARYVTRDKPGKVDLDDLGCPQWPPSASTHFTPRPGRNLVGGYNILMPVLGEGPQPSKLPLGTTIGNCVPAISTNGTNGFIVFGTPAPPEKAAEIKVIAESPQSLLIQVFDPTAASQPALPNGSWINLPHIEVWVPANSGFSQFGVDLNGKVYAGVGKNESLPLVERWQARDASGRSVTLLRLTSATKFDSIVMVYSQTEAGKQARLVATAEVIKNRPRSYSIIISLADFLTTLHEDTEIPPLGGNCRVRNGRLSLGS